MFKKTILLALVLALGLAALPLVGASAEETTPPNTDRLEQAWVRIQSAYAAQGERSAKSEEAIARIQSLIDRANAKGLDTTSVQAALDAFVAALPNASAIHETGAAILANHAGFDAEGNVTDAATALETVKALGQVVKNTHAAMNGTGQALKEAIKAFREANNLTGTAPVTP